MLAEEQATAEAAAPPKMAHDDVIGESIDEHEAAQVSSPMKDPKGLPQPNQYPIGVFCPHLSCP